MPFDQPVPFVEVLLQMLVQTAYVLALRGPRVPGVPHEEPGGFDTAITGGEMIGNIILFAIIIAAVALLVKAVKKKEE